MSTILLENKKDKQTSDFTTMGLQSELYGNLKKNGYLDYDSSELIKAYGIHCPHCRVETTAEQLSILTRCVDIICYCRESYSIFNALIEIKEDNPSYSFHNVKESVFSTTWFHATSIDFEDWDKTVKLHANEVHLGTEQAAFDRGLAQYAFHASFAEDFLLYEVSLNSCAKVAEDVADDTNNSFVSELESIDVIRYVNRWEDPASVSLSVNPLVFKVVNKRVVTVEEAQARLSVYNYDPIVADEIQSYLF